MRNKVPQVTFVFWIVKIAATTLGETGGDAMSMTLNLGYAVSTAIFFAFFRRQCDCPNSIVKAALLPLLGGDRRNHHCWNHNLRLPHAHGWTRLSLDLTHPLCRSPDGVGDLVFRPWAR